LDHPASELTFASVDLLEACPENIDCLLGYELFVEWIDPLAGLEVDVELEASSLVQIEGPIELPIGADARVAVAEPVAVNRPVLNDNVGGTALVNSDQPLAMWSVVLEANEGAIPAPLAWPIETRGSFIATITPASGGAIAADDSGGVSILLIPEGASEIVPETPQGAVRHAFDPFPGCPPDAPCERRIAIVVRWFSDDPGHAATVAWRLDAGVVFHGDAEPAAGASVETRVDRETLITRAGPVITASAEGSIELDSSDAEINERRSLQLDIPEAALAAELLGGPVPAVTGTVTLHAQSSAPIEGDPVIFANLILSEGYGFHYTLPIPELNATAGEIVIFPAPNCRADRPCTDTLVLAVGLSANDRERLGGIRIMVAWKIEVRLQYPLGSQPPADAALRLSDVLP
jgi:hypothetical protein